MREWAAWRIETRDKNQMLRYQAQDVIKSNPDQFINLLNCALVFASLLSDVVVFPQALHDIGHVHVEMMCRVLINTM